ncbi:MAG: hypothetical protein ACRC0V_08565 [Fusobacteriaceae bacterium]
MKNNIFQEEELDKKLTHSLDKMDFEIKKIKFYLFILKKMNFLKKIVKK